jgi:ABC-type transport system involved in multi-copper enzyme maturation permease subunit
MIKIPTDLIETIPNEATDLALHVQLCEQRYVQLLNKFDHVDQRLDKIETTLSVIKETIDNKETATYEKYIKWGGSVIFVMTTIIVGLVTHLLFK